MADAMVIDASAIAGPSSSVNTVKPSASTSASKSKSGPPSKRTAYRPHSSIEPFYTGAGHTALSSDGRFLFTSIDEELLVTDLSVGTGRVVKRLEVDGEEISSISITPSGSFLCVTTRAASCTLFIYSITSTSPTFELSQVRSQARAHDAPVAISTIDGTSTLLATGSADGVVKVWDIQGGYITHVLRGHGGIVSAITFDIKGDRMNLMSSSVDGRVRVWDLKDRPKQGVQKPVATLGAHVSVVRGLAVSEDGTRMISGARDKTISLWEASKHISSAKKAKTSHQARWTLKETISAGEGIEACGFVDAKGETFFTGGTSSELRLWSFASGSTTALQPRGRWARSVRDTADDEEGETDELQGIVGTHTIRGSDAAADSRNVKTIISLHADSRLVFRNTTESTDRAALSRSRQLVGFNDEAVDVSILGGSESATASQMAVATNSSAIRIYPLPETLSHPVDEEDVESLREAAGSVHLLPAETSDAGHSDNVLCIDSSPYGDLIASGSKDRTARVWAFSSAEQEWKCVAIAEGHAESLGAVCFSKKSKVEGSGANFMVTASQDRTVKIWDLSPLAELDAAATVGSKPLRLKSLVTLKVHEKAINAVQVAPNDSLLVTASQDRTAKLFSLSYTPPSKTNSQTASAKLSLLNTLKGHKRGVWSVGFSPVDAAVYTTSGDRTAKLWSIKDSTCVKTYEGHSNSVLGGHFLGGSRGTQLLTCGADGLVKLWNVRDEECTTTLEASDEERIWSAQSFAQGSGIVTVGADGVIRIFRDVTAELKEEQLKAREEEVDRDQQFENLVAVEDYKGAILLALAAGQPRRLLSLFTAVANKRPGVGASEGEGAAVSDAATQLLFSSMGLTDTNKGVASTSTSNADADATSITGLSCVDAALSSLPLSHLALLFNYIRTWNSSSRTSPIAQSILHCILRSYAPSDILSAFDPRRQPQSQNAAIVQPGSNALGGGGPGRKGTTKPPTLPELLEALIPYSERHYARAERMSVEASILEYTVRSLGEIVDDDDDEEEEEEEDLVMDQQELHSQDEEEEEMDDVEMNGVSSEEEEDSESEDEDEEE